MATGPRDRPALSDAVRDRRIDLGLRQGDLADLAGCSERFVFALEDGKVSIRLDKLLDVLAVLGLDLVVESGLGRLVAPDSPRPGRRRVSRPRP
jgi:y4mF family transcriptional regulator